MKIGLVGPADWSKRIDEFNEYVEVLWGTDEPTRVSALLVERDRVDAVVIEGSIDFLTSTVVSSIVQARVRVFALVDPPVASHWTDSIDGVTRVSSLADVRTTIVPTTDARPDMPTRDPVEAEPTADREFAERRGTVIAVWGPVGSPGITSVAIALAVLASRDGRTVALCDADSRGASISIALGLIDDVPGFAAACRLAGRDEFTQSEFRRLALAPHQLDGRLSVLTGLPRASRWSETAAPKARKVVAAIRQWSDVVVVDVGSGIEENEWIDGAPQRDGGSRAILADADIVVAVGQCDAVGISRFIRGLDELKDLCVNPLVVVNRATRQSAREAKDALQRFSDSHVSVTVHEDSRGGVEDAAARSSGGMKEIWSAVKDRIHATDASLER